MRVSTSTIYDSGVAAMQQQNQLLLHTEQQLSTGNRIITPADDPVGAAQALVVTQSQSINAQYTVNCGTASDSLSLEESTLGNVTTLLQSVRDVLVQAGDPALSQSDRADLAQQLQGDYQDLVGLANSTDGSGQYLFSGYQSGVQPFTESASGNMVYNGDQGQRMVQVSPSRQIAVSDSGDDVFQRIPDGNGTFTVQAASSNSGSGVIDTGTVLDASKWNSAANSKNLSIQFSVTGGTTTYSIYDTSGGGHTLLAGPRAYTSGAAIELGSDGPPPVDFGAQVSVTGTPADGDSFSIKASTQQDVFTTINNMISLLSTAPNGTAVSNGLASGQLNLDNALQNVTTVRAATGSRLQELDAIKSAGSDRALQYSTTLSQLQDVDYAKAASDLAQEQLNLQAAQKSFVQVAGLSVFNYL